jgi:hypothetical protein
MFQLLKHAPDREFYRHSILESLSSAFRWYANGSWGESASTTDLEVAAKDLLYADDDQLVLAYLRVFSQTVYPGPHGVIAGLMLPEDEDIAWAAT